MKPDEYETSIDKAIIVASTALLGTLVAVISFHGEAHIFVRYFLAASVVFSSSTILLSFWHLLRFPKRLAAVISATQEAGRKMLPVLTHVQKEIIEPSVLGQVAAMPDGITKADLVAMILKENNKHQCVFDAINYKWSHDMWNEKERVMYSPLSERFSKTRFVVDMIAMKCRYISFFLAVSFIATSIVGLTIRPLNEKPPTKAADTITKQKA